MRKNWKPILALIIISIAFTELLTGNLSIDVMLANPIILLFLILIGYGLPIVLIRELFVRWKAGLPSMILLGLAYGIWNEGILAKTFLMNDSVPVETFDGYVAVFGINIAWAFVISAWHAFHAVLYPILIIHFLYPTSTGRWLSTRLFVSLLVIILFLGSLFYFTNNDVVVGTEEAFVPMVAAMAALAALAYAFRKKGQLLTSSRPTVKRLAVYGAVFVAALLMGASILTSLAVPTWGIVLAVIVLLVWILKLFSRLGRTYPNILLFGLGDYALSTIFTMIFVGRENQLVMWTVIALLIITIHLMRRLYRAHVKVT